MYKISSLNQKECFKATESKKNYNKDLFSFIALKYDKSTRLLSFGRDQSWKSKLVKLLPDIQEPTCLDLACGTGDITFRLAKKYPTAKIYGLDITPKMLEKASMLNSFSNIEFVCEDMCNSSFEDNKFDIITASYALRNSPDLKKALTEISRVLKPNGILAVFDLSKFDNHILQKVQYHVLKNWGFFWGMVLHATPDTYGYLAESLWHQPSDSEFKKLFNEFNFSIINNKKFFFGCTQITILRKNS